MKLSLFGLLSFLTIAFPTAATVAAQEPECPRIHVEISPRDLCEPPVEFAVRIDGARSSNRSYSWSVYNGKIVSGEGTATIRVVSNPGSVVSATVEIGGLDQRCSKSASATRICCPAPPPVRLLDGYSILSFTKEKSRLDQFARQLKNEPAVRGFILVTGDRIRAERAKRYLVTHHGIEADRIVAVSKKKKGSKLRTRLFMVPTGTLPPAL